MAKFTNVMKAEEVQDLIQKGLEGATALIQQHQAVYQTLGTFLTNEIHALQLKTSTE